MLMEPEVEAAVVVDVVVVNVVAVVVVWVVWVVAAVPIEPLLSYRRAMRNRKKVDGSMCGCVVLVLPLLLLLQWLLLLWWLLSVFFW